MQKFWWEELADDIEILAKIHQSDNSTVFKGKYLHTGTIIIIKYFTSKIES